MKRLIAILTSSLLLAASADAQDYKSAPAWGDQHNGSYRNPVLNADFSDPDVIRVGSKYYMVASDFHFMGMQILESDDLVNWKYLTHIYPKIDFAAYDSNDRYAGGSWAPAIRYHDGEYYVYFCTPHEGLFMTKAKDPAGPWSPLLLVKAVEKWEDPCPFWDDDGQAYLGHSLYGAGPIIIHKMSADGTRLLDDGVTVYQGPVAEGTKIHKIDGTYYLSIPEGGVKGGWQTLLRAPDIYGPYEQRRVLETGSTNVNGPHQGALVDTPEGKWHFVHFQETDALGRVMHLQPVTWPKGEWPMIGVDYDGNGVGEPVEFGLTPSQGCSMALATSDDFTDSTLAPQWQFNHNPVDSAVMLDHQYGSLSLKALKAPSLRKAKNTVTQKAVGWQGAFTTALQTAEMADGQRAGVACMGKQNYMLGVRMIDGQRSLYLSNDTVEEEIAPLAKSLRPVYLRLNFDFPKKEYQFEYSLNGKDYISAGKPFYTRWGNWKGVRPALYSYNVDSDGGIANFQWADYIHDGNNAPVHSVSPAFDRQKEEAIVANIARTTFPDRIITVDYTPDYALAVLQQAIDSCSLCGGGTVDVQPGIYNLDGALVIKSNVNLHLNDGATLMFSGRADDFLPVVFSRWEGTELYGHSPMVYALHATNIAITGRGTIDARADVEMGVWGETEMADRDRLRAQGEDLAPMADRIYGEGTILRPTCIEFIGCSRILIEDVTIKNSPFWTIHPVYCDNVVVSSVTIDSHFPNNDGCDPDSSSNILIENCTFNVGDDAIAIKAGRDRDGRNVGRPSENIVIRHCLFNSECNGLCIGSEMSGGVSNVFMHDIQIGTVKNAIYFKSNRDRGGYIRNVYVSDITVDHTLGAVLRFETNYFGFRGGQHATQYEDFFIRNITARLSDNYGLFISGYPEKPVRNVLVENMSVASAPIPYYLHCTDNVTLRNVRVNGQLLPEHPADDPHERTLDIY